MDCSRLPEAVSAVAIIFTNDFEIRKFNREYRNKDKPTDVLSFSAIEGLDCPFETSLGELVISLDTAQRQAKEYQVTLSEEIARLIVHGMLHLFGYDHEKVPAAVAQRMRRKEKEIFRMFGPVSRLCS